LLHHSEAVLVTGYREVQQLHAEVRESDQVKFAVHIYTALNSCNYVKFFKLVHTATFLNICILHRYFNQMRACCLQRLRAYVMPGHTAAVVLFILRSFLIFCEIRYLLECNNQSRCIQILESHGKSWNLKFKFSRLGKSWN